MPIDQDIIIQVQENDEPIIVQVSDSLGPVQSVNGKIGWVTITKEDLGVTGYALSGDLNNYYLNSNPSNFISSDPPTGSGPLDLLIKYVTGINTGIISYEGIFPNIYFTEKPVLFISLSYEGAETIIIDGSPVKNRYITDLTYSNQTGFGINFSSQILETGINLNVLAYGKGVNL